MQTRKKGYSIGVWFEGKPVVLNSKYDLKKTSEYDDSVSIRCGKYVMKDGVEIGFQIWGESELTLMDIVVSKDDVPHIAKNEFLAYLEGNGVVVDQEVHPLMSVMEHNERYIVQILLGDGE